LAALNAAIDDIRRWKGSDGIRAQFKECQADALSLLTLFGTFQLLRELKRLEKQSKKPISHASSSGAIVEGENESTTFDEGETTEREDEEDIEIFERNF